MIYELPPLPYGINDLAPVISQETIEYHYGKHEQTYIDNLNKLIEGTPFADKPLEEIIKEADGALFHILFLHILPKWEKKSTREVGRSYK